MKREIYVLMVFIIILITLNLPAQVNNCIKINSKIVDVEWLSDQLNDPELVILHVSPLKPEYDREHIPGARFMYSGWLTISTPGEQAVFIPDKEMKEILESLGISNSSKIVLSFMNGLLTSTCRVYIALDHLGLGDQSYILSGGVEAWKSAGKSVVKDIPVIKKGKLTLAPKGNVVYSTEWIEMNLKSPNVTLIDTRSAPFYAGTSGGPRYGHIPGALNIPMAKLYDEKNRFLPEEELKTVFQNAGIKLENELVTYCFVGNAASVVYFVARSLGYNVHLYDGSMDEWGNRFDLPLEKVEVKETQTSLFPDNAGRLFRLSGDAKNELILNMKTPKINLADFEYIPGIKVPVIPTF
jgi:thiosulfate/3-mercaptopyruvate sulfurtransferase